MNSKSNCDNIERDIHLFQRHLLSVAPKSLAAALDIDISAVSRIRSGERGLKIDEFVKIMSIPSATSPQGLQLASGNTLSITRAQLLSLRTLARDYLNMTAAEETL